MESHLKWPDYLILAGFLVISLAIGIYHAFTGGRQKTTAEFILADRRLKVIPTAISLFVTYQSGIFLLGMTAEMYSYGAQFLVFTGIASALAVFTVERIIVPWLHPLKLVSMFDYLEKRYMSKSVRIFGSSLGILQGVLFMGVAMYAPSAALESATGLPLAVSIPLMAVVSVTYTALGGMRAVVWTDVFQFLTMMGGNIAILVKGLVLVGGITNVFQLAGEEGRLVLANVSFDPRERHTAWNLLVGLGSIMFYNYGVSQASIQRFSAVKKLSQARITVLLNIPPVFIINVMGCIIGLVVVAYYASIKCDPLANKDVANPNQLLPYFVVTIFADSPGFAGLFLATLYGGSLSTLSSMLSGTAANCWEDMLKWKLDHLPETRKAVINRLLVVLFGFLATGVALFSASLPGPVTQVTLSLLSLCVGPLMAIFLLGGISKHANWKGTLTGGVMGVLLTLWLSIGAITVKHKHPPLAPVSVEHCFVGNNTFTSLLSSQNYTNDNSFDVWDGIDTKNGWNQTSEALLEANNHTTQLRGVENFYAISYLWTFPFGAIVTGVIGIVASFIMRDRDLEEKVDKRLLLRFHGCGWSEEEEHKEYLDDENNASIQENKVVKGPENGFLMDLQRKAAKETDMRINI